MIAPDAGLAWRKSSYSTSQSNCVEIAQAPEGGRWLRDSKCPGHGVHHLSAAGWHAFIANVKVGKFG